ncbi:MAG: energy transducer TonB [Pseudomonadota bacterium]|nr:energy transducer TonB [Pseudomonadota bacterium]
MIAPMNAVDPAASAPAPIRPRDRLVSTLLFAALAHGVLILGLGFAPPEREPAEPLGSKLEVTLVTGQATTPPENPDYLAQIDRSGAGNTEERVRASAPPASVERAASAGIEAAAQLRDELPDQPTSAEASLIDKRPDAAPEQLLTQQRSARRTPSAPQQAGMREGERPRVALLRLQPAPATPADAEPEAQTRVTGQPLRERRISVNTRSNVYAPYLYNWRLRIEEIGNLNFPDEVLREGLYGDVTIEVAIAADGSLAELAVRRPSPHPALDQAALRILRLAAPFAPFTPEMRLRSEVVRFVWVWQFLPGEDGGGRQEGGVYADG